MLAGIASGVAAGIVRIVGRVADNDLGILRRLVVLLGYPVVVVWQRLPIIVVIAPAYRASAAGAAAVVVAAIVAVVTAAGVGARVFTAAGVVIIWTGDNYIKIKLAFIIKDPFFSIVRQSDIGFANKAVVPPSPLLD